jgi:Uncharacterized protein conserved in bacteria
MPVFVALLRGVNVGGKNKVNMAELKRLFESIGANRVETYIQSGNVLFEASESEEALAKKIACGFEKAFGFSPAVVLRSAEELERLILDCPFSGEEIAAAESLNSEGESLYVSLFSQAPVREKAELLNAFRSKNDEFRIINRDMYLLLRHSIRNSKLANSLQKLDLPGTVRNWKTINKLHTLITSRTDNK